MKQGSVNSSPDAPQVYEVGLDGKPVPNSWSLRDVSEDHFSEKDSRHKLLSDFGVKRSGESSFDHTNIREEIAQAIRQCDEVSLAKAVDKARSLGEDLKWRHELDEAETLLYEMTLSDFHH